MLTTSTKCPGNVLFDVKETWQSDPTFKKIKWATVPKKVFCNLKVWFMIDFNQTKIVQKQQ